MHSVWVWMEVNLSEIPKHSIMNGKKNNFGFIHYVMIRRFYLHPTQTQYIGITTLFHFYTLLYLLQMLPFHM